MKLNYGITIFWSYEGNCFIATCPDFPGISAFGNTRRSCLKYMKEALRTVQNTMLEDGKGLPSITTRQEFDKLWSSIKK